ncbi:hypothetical protein AYI82_10140 [Shewanella algae]|uniref:DUF4339 domain-containing protein n=1 Tax=Shewanella algae TaxID=38313 RepID=UPI0011836DD5|nr:DUF4339 domain-containing protein [Shewanella algae]TVL08690.1 hypothetical protein AYI82_10140 [Shewanella algae]
MSGIEEIKSQELPWFYEAKGERKGGVSEVAIVELIKNGTISYGTSVWRKGFPDWMKVENTELKAHLDDSAPPPLTGENVNNTIIWFLAFAPAIGLFLEGFVAGIVYGDNEYRIEEAISGAEFWYITLILNIALSIFDSKRLKAAGHNTDKFKGWVWLVPVYLFQRAKALKQNYAYFAVWIVCFLVSLSV